MRNSACIPILIIYFFLVSCKPTTNLVGRDPLESVPIRQAVGEQFQVEIFKNQNLPLRKVDIILVVDNSVSMANEIQNVRSNIGQFLEHLKKQFKDPSDLKIALLSRSTRPAIVSRMGDTSLQLPAGFLSIDGEVGSKNALAMLASSLCLENETQAIGPMNIRICGFDGNFIEGRNDVLKVRGALSGFMRTDARAVFVFVTDDDANGMSDVQFLSLIKNRFLASRPVVFAFVGLPDESSAPAKERTTDQMVKSLTQGMCAIANPGLTYATLAKQTGGEIFDLCEKDWAPLFAKLHLGIVKQLQQDFTLVREPKQIIELTIDGQVQESNNYSFVGNRLTVLVLPDGYKAVQVKYK